MPYFIALLFALSSFLNKYCLGSDFSVSTDILEFDYHEEDSNGQALMRESGTMLGGRTELNIDLTPQITLSLSRTIASNTVNYNGATQSGASLRSETRERFTRDTLSIAYNFKAASTRITPYLLVGQQEWNRLILATPSSLALETQYTWQEYQAGLNYRFKTPWGQLQTTIFLMQLDDAKAKVDLTSVSLGTPTIVMGEGKGAGISLTHAWLFSKNWELRQSFWHKQWSFEASDSTHITQGDSLVTLREPTSKTKMTGINWSIGMLW